MNCDECKSHLIDHAYGELPPGDAAPVARHLSECSACALEFCRLRADLDGVTQAHVQSPAPSVAHRLRTRVQAHFAPPWWRRAAVIFSKPVPVYGAMAAAVVPLAVWLGINAAVDTTQVDRPRPPAGPALIEDYDATNVLRVDPNLL